MPSVLAHAALRAVGGDHVLRAHASRWRRVTVFVSVATTPTASCSNDVELGVEAQLARGLPLGAAPQHRLEIVLGAQAGAHRRDLGPPRALRHGTRRSISSPASVCVQTISPMRSGGRPASRTSASMPLLVEDLHGAGIDAARLGMDGGAGMALGEQRRMPSRDSRNEAVRPTGPPPAIRTGTSIMTRSVSRFRTVFDRFLQPQHTRTRSAVANEVPKGSEQAVVRNP